MGLFERSYPDTFKGGQECREDVDALRVILHEKEPKGYSEEFLRGFRNPKGEEFFSYDERGWKPD